MSVFSHILSASSVAQQQPVAVTALPFCALDCLLATAMLFCALDCLLATALLFCALGCPLATALLSCSLLFSTPFISFWKDNLDIRV